MDKTKICEALYALPGEVVVRRRKSLAVPAVVLLAGAAMIVANEVYAAALTNNVSSALVFAGGILALAGLVLLAARVFGSEGAPYYRGGRCFLRYDACCFGRSERDEVMRRVAAGDVRHLLEMPRSRVPAVTVAVYRTPDNRFAAMQAFEYADLEYKPLTDLTITGGPVA